MPNNVTPNLLKWFNKLQKLRNSVLPAAISNVLPKIERQLHDILWREMERAIAINSEFDYHLFKRGLKRAAYTPGIISVRARRFDSEGLFSLVVHLNMDGIAGNILDYKQAVESVRAERSRETALTRLLSSSNKDISAQEYNVKTYYETEQGQANIRKRASWYWKNFIYGQAREGKSIKQKREPGQKGRTPTHKKEGKQMYRETMKDRFDLLDTPAPFWSILDQGVAGASALEAGGFAHPEAVATNFVWGAENKIKAFLGKALRSEVERLSMELERQEYGAGDIFEQIEKVILQFGDGNINWVPGQILKELELGEKRYNLYITKTERLGFAQAR